MISSVLLLHQINQSCSEHLSVYIHAGQSNMEGHGSIEHLRQLIQNPETSSSYSHLIEPDTQEFITIPDVYCRYNIDERKGPLTVGFGFRTHKFGP